MCKRIFVLFVIHSFLLQAASGDLAPKRGLSPKAPAFVPSFARSVDLVHSAAEMRVPVCAPHSESMSSTSVVEQDTVSALDQKPYLTDFQRACAAGSILRVKEYLNNYESLTLPTRTGSYPLTLVLYAQISTYVRHELCNMLLLEAKKRNEDIASLLDSKGDAPFVIALREAKGREKELDLADLILDHTHNVGILNVALDYVTENRNRKIMIDDVQYFANKISDKIRMQNLLAYRNQLNGVR